MDFGPPGSFVHGIIQVRILEWVAIYSSRDLPNPGIEPVPPALADGFVTTDPREANKAPRMLLQKQTAINKYYLLFNLLLLFSKIHCLCKCIKKKLDDFLDKIIYSHKI